MTMMVAVEWNPAQVAVAVLIVVLTALALGGFLFKQRTAKAPRADAPPTLREYIAGGMNEADAKFQVAVDFVAAQPSSKLSNEQRLTLYAFYKQALLGKCTAERPAAVDVVGRAKWESWSALGEMAKEAAKAQYVGLVHELFPHFDGTGEQPRGPHPLAEKIQEDQGGAGVSMAGTVSMPAVDMSAPEWQVKEDVFHFASTGDVAKIDEALAQGTDVNAQDDEGRTMLHWAIDRSQTAVVQLLLAHNAAPNAQDTDGMTPLHYAVSCEDEPMTELLVSHGALTDVEDNDGETPLACAATTRLQAILAQGKTKN